MEANNFIFQYYQAITDGSIIAGVWIKKWYQQVIKDLENKSYIFDAKRANQAIKFLENFVHHHEGALAPQCLKLELWQKAFISVIFGCVDADGCRHFREVLLIVSRKVGKTLLAAGIAEYMSLFDDYGARIYFAAPKLDQARLCYEAYYQSIKKEPEIDSLCKRRRTDIYIESKNASAAPLPFSAKKSDGLNISLCICDEIAAWEGDAGLKFYEVIKSSQGGRKQPMILSISTANFINDGIYDELIKRATAVINGGSKEKRLAPFLYMIDDIQKWNDINELAKANPNLGVSVSVDYMLEEIAIAEGSLSKRSEFLCKYCNVKQNSSIAWVPASAVEKCSGEEIKIESFKSTYCVGGIDLSQCNDLTSACLAIERDGVINVISHFWLPEEKLEEATAKDGLPYRLFVQKGWLSLSGTNFIDYTDVFNWFREMVEKYECLPLMIGYDRYSSQYLVKDLKAYGFQTDDVYQGYNLTGTIQQLEGLLKDGRINIGNNDLLKIHILDTAIKMDAESRRLKIIKMNRKSHIDGVAALLCALVVKEKHFETIGGKLANR